MDRSALVRATLVGTVLQVAMVVSGHHNTGVAQLFAVLGMTLSFVAGAVYARLATAQPTRAAALGGAVAGGVCGFLGIAVSVALGDVLVLLLAFGTASSAVTGALGGVAAHRLFRSGSPATTAGA